MSERIAIWSLPDRGAEADGAASLDELTATETEHRLEELLVASPDLLVRGLRLIGRQVQTSGGPLDLLGVDPDGRIILFELKRGVATREAVAQILDYGSDLIERDPDDFSNLIESSSGRSGIDRIEDFGEWFSTEYPDVAEPDLTDLRLFLVALGVDERAKRIVNLLARTGLDVQLLTFQAFRRGSEILLARQVETVEPRSRSSSSGGGTKQSNRRLLEELAREQGVLDLLLEVADFVDARMPAYRWPNKTAFTYALNEVTEEGRPTQRSYAAVAVDQKVKGRVTFSLPERAVAAASEAVSTLIDEVAQARLTSSSWTPFELPITRDSWPSVQAHLESLLTTMIVGWKERLEESKQEARSSEE